MICVKLPESEQKMHFKGRYHPKTYILAIDNVKMLVGEIVVDFINVFLFVQLGLQEKGRQDKDEQASNSKNLW